MSTVQARTGMIDNSIELVGALLSVSRQDVRIYLHRDIDFSLVFCTINESFQTQDQYLVDFIGNHCLSCGLISLASLAVHCIISIKQLTFAKFIQTIL